MSGEDLPAAAVVLTQVAVAQGLAAACALSKVPVDAVPTDIGAVGVCRTTAVGDPERAAAVISKLLKNTPVVLLTQRDGQMTASRWSAGSKGEDIAPVLMLDGAPPVVEQLLLGQVTPQELPGVVSSVGMSRWTAMRILAAAAKRRRA
ncbi:hypothetical protein [Actinotalea sp. K2]|uniref:hypothetical protein n=1 Tax=Actinotalea sp. K2 TaxID=2939438 RepID=UPI002016CFC8|nr:hypothetical protein [Actinotalea sp. K2]MCL3860101.1 hypothetical protein [Actinotalea sp. K2]